MRTSKALCLKSGDIVVHKEYGSCVVLTRLLDETGELIGIQLTPRTPYGIRLVQEKQHSKLFVETNPRLIRDQVGE